MAVCKSKLSFDLLETRGSSYFFFGTYCVLSGEGSVLNGKSLLCELIIMQKSSLLKEALFFVTLEFIFYRGKIDNLRRIYLRGRYK